MTTVTQSETKLHDLRTIIIPFLKPYARKVTLFGSFARGDDTAESDRDLVIELRPQKERPRLGLRWFGLEAELSKTHKVFEKWCGDLREPPGCPLER